ncbi:MAG: DUF4058 family protein, partial [Planctomycetes bacterium]|nr:DUF4058 family protein [Planctomycetota bacterium]
NGGHTAIAEHETPLWVQTPAFTIPEWRIEIRASRGKRLVTAIEILSPSNKSARGDGRELYLQKQREILASKVNLVEIDLLRAGAWTLAVPWDAVETAPEFDYAVSVSRAADRNGYEFYPIRLEDRLPRIAIPLDAEDPDAVADLQSLLDRCYTRGKYAEDIDYTKPPAPPLPTRKAAWARRIVRGARRK